MKDNIKNIMCGGLLLVGIGIVAWVLNHYFGAVVSGIYATISIISVVFGAYELHHAPVMEEEELSTENQ